MNTDFYRFGDFAIFINKSEWNSVYPNRKKNAVSFKGDRNRKTQAQAKPLITCLVIQDKVIQNSL